MFRLSQILLSPRKATKHPIEIIFAGFFYATISMLMSLWIFPEHASLFMVFLTVIACLYLVEGILIVEEKKEKNINSETSLLKSHAKTLFFFVLLFIGFLLSATFWTIVLPENTVSTAFHVQEDAFQSIRSITGKATSLDNFSAIFSNNLRVLFLSLLLALFYGAGAVFILAWNASIMGFVIGSLAKNIFGIVALPQIFLKYFLHGIPEMLAYFAVSLAGGILFISIVKGDIKKGRTKRILTDTFIVILIAIFLLFASALIETYVSPLI